jgi:phosphoketolase
MAGRELITLALPDFTDYALEIPGPGQVLAEAPRKLGDFFRDIFKMNPKNFRMFCPDESDSNRLNSIFEATKRCSMAEIVSIDEKLGPGWSRHGSAERASLPGMARRLPAYRAPWHVVLIRSLRAGG